MSYIWMVFNAVFFFQAEDGIRDRNVTGVKTCALPISGVTLTPDILAKEKAAQSTNLANVPVIGTPLAIIDATVQAAQATSDIAAFFTGIAAFFTGGGWIRIGKIVAGSVMVL